MNYGSSNHVSKRDKLVNILRTMISQGELDHAHKTILRISSKHRSDTEILHLSAIVDERRGACKSAIKKATKAARRCSSPDLFLLLARCYRQIGDPEEALLWCKRTEDIDSHGLELACIQAGILEESGKIERAMEVVQSASDRYVSSGSPVPLGLTIEEAKVRVQRKEYSKAIKLIDHNLRNENLSESSRSQQLYLKAKAFDRAGRYDQAWAAAEKANSIGAVDYNPELHKSQVDTLLKIWSREAIGSFPLSKCESTKPIFIAGMPRSGTTLIDQIIDAHPLAAGVGECDTIEQFAHQVSANYIAELDPPECFGKNSARIWSACSERYIAQVSRGQSKDVRVIANKALGNNKLLGIISRLFPKTKIIHVIRDPRDVAVSCFMGAFNNRMHAWTVRPAWVAHVWELSRNMLKHWEQVLDVEICTVHYENLVSCPEREIPRIIGFLGLDMDEACFRFYKSAKWVRTLSYDQVNRPLYTTSKGRYINYQAHLQNVKFPEYTIRSEGAEVNNEYDQGCGE